MQSDPTYSRDFVHIEKDNRTRSGLALFCRNQSIILRSSELIYDSWIKTINSTSSSFLSSKCMNHELEEAVKRSGTNLFQIIGIFSEVRQKRKT
jgi:hypothetical protein